MELSRPAPRYLAGFAGMLVVAILYVVHAFMLKSTGRGLPPAALLALCAPGAFAAHICAQRGMDAAAEKEGALAGVITACFAAPAQLLMLILAVLNTDWAAYAAQAGPDVAAAARDAAVPATAVLTIVAVALAFAGCTFAALLGALAYNGVRALVTQPPSRQSRKNRKDM